MVNSEFQKNRLNPKTNKIRNHNGIDVIYSDPETNKKVRNSIIRSAGDGTVTNVVKSHNGKGAGKMVKIKHKDGY